MEENLYQKFYEIENEHWWFKARREIIGNFVETKYPHPPSAALLDIGCGTGSILKMFSQNFDVYGQDVSLQAIDFCKKRGLKKLFCGDTAQLPSDFTNFDIVTTLDVIEHIENDLLTLQQVYRRLKNGGMLLVTVPAFQFLWGRHDVITHHKRRYTKDSLIKVIEKAGFRIEFISYFNFFLFPIALLRRLFSRFFSGVETDDLKKPQSFINQTLYIVFKVEGFFLPRIKYPFGLSLICMARKINSK